MSENRDIVVFVCGKYDDLTPDLKELHIRQASLLTTQLWDMGFTVLCPHMNRGMLEYATKNTGESDFQEGDRQLMDKSDVVIMMPNWQRDEVSVNNREFAFRRGLPVVSNVKELLDWKVDYDNMFNKVSQAIDGESVLNMMGIPKKVDKDDEQV